MTIEKFNEEMASIPTADLIKMAEEEVRTMCKTGGQSFTMRVPVSKNDTDVVLTEIIKRLKFHTNV